MSSPRGSAATGEESNHHHDGRVMELKAYRRVLEAYYLWVTPIFFALDFYGGISLRADALPDPGIRYGYYAALMALGLVVHWRPRAAPFVGMGESATNILLLVLSVMMPIWANVDAAASGGDLQSPMTTGKLLNFVLVGSVLVWSFQQNQAAALGRAGPTDR